MVKIAAMAETTGTIYNYWGELVCDPGCAEGGGERKKKKNKTEKLNLKKSKNSIKRKSLPGRRTEKWEHSVGQGGV